MRGFAAVSFVLICLLSGSLWLLPVAEGTSAEELFQLALSSILSFALVLLAFSWHRQISQQGEWAHLGLALSGIATISVPTLLLWIGRHNFSSVMAVASQAGVPIVVAVAAATLGGGGELQTRLVPGLVGLTGALLLLPVALPRSSSGWTGLVCYVAAAGCGGVGSIVCHQQMMQVSPRRALLTVAAANAIVLSLFTTVWLVITATWREAVSMITLPSLFSLAAQSVSIAGVLLLLRALSPLAFASRFLFIPLVATAEALLLLHLPLSPRACIGAVLMLGAGLLCLRSDSDEASSTTTMSLR